MCVAGRMLLQTAHGDIIAAPDYSKGVFVTAENKSFIVASIAAALFATAAPCMGQTSRNGVSGGYTGSDQWFKSQSDSARQRATLQNNLGADNAAAGGTGAEIRLQITFPDTQRGLGNITRVVLKPADAGAAAVTGLASNKVRNVITTAFAPRKGVVGGHDYSVLVTDARGHSYPVGQIRVEPTGSPQTFNISAPLLR